MNSKTKKELQKLIKEGRAKEWENCDEEIDSQLKAVKVNLNILTGLIFKGYFEGESEKIIKFLLQDSQETLNTVIKERQIKYVSQDTLDSRAWNEFYRGGD